MQNNINNIKNGILALASSDPNNNILSGILALARMIPDQQQPQQQQQQPTVEVVSRVSGSNGIVGKLVNNKKIIKQRYGGTVRQVRKHISDIINLLKRMSSDNMEVFGFSEFEIILSTLDSISQEIASESVLLTAKKAQKESSSVKDGGEGEKRSRETFEAESDAGKEFGNVVEVDREKPARGRKV